MSGFCPHCGYDLAKAEAVEDGPFRFDPRTGFFIDGVRLKQRRMVHELLGSIMSAKGTAVAQTVLAERLGYEGDNIGNYLAVHLTFAREAFAKLRIHFPIETVRGYGFRWLKEAEQGPLVRHAAQVA